MADLFHRPDGETRCTACRFGSHRACAGRTCTCDHPARPAPEPTLLDPAAPAPAPAAPEPDPWDQ